jgi:hypothetical protein
MVAVVQLDEAFVDFWSDALLDPVASSWPNFVICKLKNPIFPSAAEAPASAGTKSIGWLVIEHVYKTIVPAATAPPVEHVESPSSSPPQTSKRARPSSPKPSFRSDLSASRVSSTIAATKKRFSFLTSVRTSISSDGERSAKSRKKSGRGPRVGEMGEILSEEGESSAAAAAAAPAEPTPAVAPKPVEHQHQPEVVKPGVAAVGPVTAAVAAAVLASAAEDKAPQPEIKALPTPPDVRQEPEAAQVATVTASAPSAEAPARSDRELLSVPIEPQSVEPASAVVDEVVPVAVPEEEVQALGSAEPSGAAAVSQVVVAPLAPETTDPAPPAEETPPRTFHRAPR